MVILNAYEYDPAAREELSLGVVFIGYWAIRPVAFLQFALF